jgi:hypothetical protein
LERPCWTLNHATDGIGRAYPQLQGFPTPLAPAHDAALDDLPHGRRLPDDMTFPTAVLAPGAKCTDLISTNMSGLFGFLISERLRRLLDQFRLHLHQYFPAPLEQRKRSVGVYWWLYLPDPDLPLTDEMSPVEAEAVIAADPVLGAVDVLRVYAPPRYRNCYVGGPVRAALEAAGVTGVRFGTAKLFR